MTDPADLAMLQQRNRELETQVQELQQTVTNQQRTIDALKGQIDGSGEWTENIYPPEKPDDLWSNPVRIISSGESVGVVFKEPDPSNQLDLCLTLGRGEFSEQAIAGLRNGGTLTVNYGNGTKSVYRAISVRDRGGGAHEVDLVKIDGRCSKPTPGNGACNRPAGHNGDCRHVTCPTPGFPCEGCGAGVGERCRWLPPKIADDPNNHEDPPDPIGGRDD